jgi:mono/diheme cytochrome c family protein
MTLVALLSLLTLGAACTYQPLFDLPIEEGDIDAGLQAFIDHRCHQCHNVAGVRLPELTGASAPLLELGGETSYLRAYSDLVTSIINPDHRIAEPYREQMERRALLPLESPMPMAHIDTMTVRQLIDIVAFLDSRYILIEEYDPEL